jgi:predicted RNA binding protein YcfA (HicA-like mRNA interferase family)
MKRRELVRRLGDLGCILEREGAQHTIYRAPSGLKIAVPRHTEIAEGTARKILREAASD